MNLRDKFLWNAAIICSFLAISWNGWNLFNVNTQTNKSLAKFKNEQVGTDKDLENKVSELENIYVSRDAMKFIMQGENPVDLNKVVSLSGGRGNKKRGNLWVSGIINRANGLPMALMNYKDVTYSIQIGDSIAGGLIKDITTTKVMFEKNEEIRIYNLGLNQAIE